MNCKIINAISPKTDTYSIVFKLFIILSLKCSYGFFPIVNFAKGSIICLIKIILFENFATFPVPVPRFAL
ncbi:MAG: hypothetical protein Ct9H300mP21_06180 [Pseudomonadota bacterium]|nr:MAG: hypothetical protein Ct9H300mP21_06180 [Pseudomonadota bacterium]